MNSEGKRVTLIGNFALGTLESSYSRAFTSLGWAVQAIDCAPYIQRYVRLNRVGSILNRFVPVKPWIRKANRDIVLEVFGFKPDLILTFGNPPLLVGSFAYLRSTVQAKLIHVWPDPFLYWSEELTVALPLFDLIGSYSRESLSTFQCLGAKNPLWLPFAADPELHPYKESVPEYHAQYAADISFIGGWRPEREAALSQLGNFNLKIWGPEWGRRCKNNPTIMRAWQGRAVFGEEFSKVVACSAINLNIIDRTNFPSANMRFFEVPGAGGFQLASLAPEMEEEWRDGQEMAYFSPTDDLPTVVRHWLADESARRRIARAAHALSMARHTYPHRVQTLLSTLSND